MTCSRDIVDLENALRCQRPPVMTLKISTTYHHKDLVKYEVGYETVAANFAKLMDFYHDPKTISTIYARSTISMHIAFSQDLMENMDQDLENQNEVLSNLYKFQNQEKNLDLQIHCHGNCDYLNDSSDFVFVPQRLTPKSSLMYDVSRKAADLHLNFRPMWKSISKGNWAKIETHVNAMASDLGRDLVTLSGAAGHLRLKDKLEKRSKSIYLDAVQKNFVVPLYFWKIVYDPKAFEGIVFVTINNPYLGSKMEIDRSIACMKPFTTGLGIKLPESWRPKNIGEGYSYMCKVSDFMHSSGLVDDIEENLKMMEKFLIFSPKAAELL